jgi:hypothetical protein
MGDNRLAKLEHRAISALAHSYERSNHRAKAKWRPDCSHWQDNKEHGVCEQTFANNIASDPT